MTWTPSTTAYDRAGNANTSAAANENGSSRPRVLMRAARSLVVVLLVAATAVGLAGAEERRRSRPAGRAPGRRPGFAVEHAGQQRGLHGLRAASGALGAGAGWPSATRARVRRRLALTQTNLQDVPGSGGRKAVRPSGAQGSRRGLGPDGLLRPAGRHAPQRCRLAGPGPVADIRADRAPARRRPATVPADRRQRVQGVDRQLALRVDRDRGPARRRRSGVPAQPSGARAASGCCAGAGWSRGCGCPAPVA